MFNSWGKGRNVGMNGLGLQCFMLHSCHAAVIHCLSHIVVGTECHHLQEKPVLSSVFCREMNIHRCNLLFGSKAKLHLQCGHLMSVVIPKKLVSANMEELMPSLYLCLLFALPLPVKTDNSGVLLLYNVK